MKALLLSIASLPLVGAAWAQDPAPASSSVRRFSLPVETGAYRPGPGLELAQSFCLTCHSVEYTETQPPSAEKYWDATVKKMKEKFGAPIPDDAVGPIVKYLTTTYGKKSP